ncbi:MAG TPA: gephyrin-like molybdotransferase Glp [Polyangiaceae bacterium]|nr:gephyrin-like molybdotransferase Glp [Polyangiaceae bacterium]
MGTSLLPFDEARARLLADVRVLAAERVPLAEAAGRVLATDVHATEAVPPFDHSAMDGYAVRSADLAGDGPWELPLVGESAAGRLAPPLAPRATCRILTGAPVPPGADAVVMQEQVTRRGEAIVFGTRPRAGLNVRRQGEDLARGALALVAGQRVSAGSIALAAMAGHAEVVVARRPVVTILCTGDELRAAGEERPPGTIPESNAAAIAALARQAGAIVRIAPIARDEPGQTLQAIQGALDGTDVLVTVGGVSVGDHDVVRPALEKAGVTLEFWRVAIKPGKPLAVGTNARARILGLPGNPASALVTFALFGSPLLRAAQGDERPLPSALRVRVAGARARSTDRLELLRASLEREGDDLVARPHDNQSSGAATSLALSDGLAFVPPGPDPVEAGTRVDFVRWSDV